MFQSKSYFLHKKEYKKVPFKKKTYNCSIFFMLYETIYVVVARTHNYLNPRVM